MMIYRIALVGISAVLASFLGATFFESRVVTDSAQISTPLIRIADDSTPDGTETQDPEQQEQQAENQQECGNPNGCG
jgi:hypothetical protein